MKIKKIVDGVEVEVDEEPIIKKENFSPFKSFGGIQTLTSKKCAGLGIRFGTPEQKDFYGDYFTPLTETGLMSGSDRPFLMEHWEQDEFAWIIVGRAVYEKQDDGWAYEATLFDNEAGELAYEKLTSEEYRSSTGSAWNYTRGIYVKNDAFMLTTWLVIEQSATKKPADYWNPPIQIKSVADFEKMSAIIAPLLAEREKDLFKLAKLEEDFNRIKSEVEQVKKHIDNNQTKGVELPPEVEEEVERILAGFKN